MSEILFKYNRPLIALISDYRKQNTKGVNGLMKILSEEVTIVKNRIKYLWLKCFSIKIK